MRRSGYSWCLNQIAVLLVVALGGLLLTLPVGCVNREPQRKPAESPVKIAFALADMNRDGNKTIKKVVDEQKKQVNAEVTWLDARNDPPGSKNSWAGWLISKLRR